MGSLMQDDDLPVVPRPVLETKSYAGITNDTRLIPTTDLLTHLNGAKWVVTYFSQLLNTDNEPTPYSPSIPPALQQYLRIDEFELKVTQALTPTNDTQLAEFQAEGTAYLFPHVIPNVGDCMLVEISPGRLGLLTVKTADVKSIFKESAYEITYQVRSFLDADTQRDLDAKTQKRVTYVRDFLRIGKNPMLVESEYTSYRSVLQLQHQAIQAYYSEFYNPEFETLLVPDQTATTYDPFLVEFFLTLVSKDHFPAYRRVEVVNCDDVNSTQVSSLWDALRSADPSTLGFCSRQMVVVPSRYVYSHPMHRTIRYSGITQVVRSAEHHTEVSTPLRTNLGAGMGKVGGFILNTDLPGLTRGTTSTTTLRLIPHFTPETYVFSEAFYTGVGELTVIESEVRKALTSTDVSLLNTQKLFDQSKRWSAFQRFYFIPVLVYLSYYALGALN